MRSLMTQCLCLLTLGAPIAALAKRPPCPVPARGYTRESHLNEMTSRDPIGRLCATEKLRDFKGPRIGRAFILALSDADARVRFAALEGLKSHPGKPVLKELIKALDPAGKPVPVETPPGADFVKSVIETGLVVYPKTARVDLTAGALELLKPTHGASTKLAGLRALEVLQAKGQRAVVTPLLGDADEAVKAKAKAYLAAEGTWKAPQ